jgi:hypothetical protein
MTFKAHSFATLLLQALVELTIFFPLILFLNFRFISISIVAWIAVLAGFYALGYLACIGLRLDKWYSLVATGLCCSCVIGYGGFGFSYTGIVTGVLGFYLLIRGTFITKRGWKNVFPIHFYWIGLIMYFVVSVLFRLNPETRVFLPALFWLGFISVALTLIMTSQERIIQESLPEKNGRHLVNPIQLRNNRLLSIAILTIIFMVAAIKQLVEGFLWLNKWFWNSLIYIVQMLSKLTSSQQKEAPPDNTATPPLLPSNDSPSVFWVWLEKILYILISAVAIAIVLFLLYKIYKWVLRYGVVVYKWLIRKLKHNRMEEASGFEDESTRLVTFGGLIKGYGSRVTDWLDWLRKREVKWSDLTTNAERVRYLYRQFVTKNLSKGTKINLHLTAEETVSAIQRIKHESSHHNEMLLSRLYNQARYSNHSIADEEVVELGKKLQGD